MRIEFFDYQLPDAAIARSPTEPRDKARLLQIGAKGEIDHLVFRQLPEILRPGDILVLNNTRVIPARLFGWRAARQAGNPPIKIEVTLHQRQLAEPHSDNSVIWAALAKPTKRLVVGDLIHFADDFIARVIGKNHEGEIRLEFNYPEKDFWAGLSQLGKVPLPPYLKRAAGSEDHQNYQTVFAARDGAVAAPTAGLHFTPELLLRLEAMGVRIIYLTLHVGAGTFLPVTVADTADHRMHSEWAELSVEAAEEINRARAAGGRVVAVGTTVLRVLESASDDLGRLGEFRGETRLFIQPGYRFKIVDILITNFHVPRSTLLILVASFVGLKRILAAYQLAVGLGYRFYSYGDATILFRRDDGQEDDFIK
ncbi:MAG: tRNA preQ1(34) S-adenosylmethionine ribosyltransferase-isomerase QueA [Candidatus Pacebacteria bacterium]|nr:tRNA preQ1(34) S-adenosylmethionine ribosyltransferase-isomerase QueA [Candidatus Paceibacterota bacterium]